MNKQKRIPKPEIIGTRDQKTPLSFKTNKQVKKLNIRKFRGYTYGEYDYVDKFKTIDNLNDYLTTTTTLFSKFMIGLYLYPTYSFRVDDSMFDSEPIKDRTDIMKQILVMSEKILAMSESKTVGCRIASDRHSFILNFGDFGNGEESFISAYMDGYKYMTKFSVDAKFSKYEEHPGIVPPLYKYGLCPFIIGKKERNVESELREIYDSDMAYLVDNTTLSLIYNSLMLLMSSINEDKLEIPDYTQFELYFIKKIFKLGVEFGSSTEFYPFDIFNWKCEDKDVDMFTSFWECDNLRQCIKDQNPEYPLIDFNRKEINFIIKYCKDNCYMCKGNTKTFNLAQYIKESPYGDTFRYKMPGGDNGEELTISCSFDEELDIMRIFISHDISDEITVFGSVGFDNITNFNMETSYVDINSSVLFKTIDAFVPGRTEAFNMMPEMFRTYENLTDIAQMFIETLIVIHDKPKRSKMIKCTERVVHQPSNKQGGGNVHKNSILVTRILKSTNDAKEYIERMSASGVCDREYVLESWQRVGYYRRAGKSGGMVWIAPTTCKRHLPLTEKEIHIKL